MISRKKRLRYKTNAIKIAKEKHEALDPENWEQIWAILDKYDEPDFLYAIVDFKSQLVKFGKSKSPGMRLRQLKTGNAGDLKIWGFCPNVAPLSERDVHTLLAAERVGGEWFRLCKASQAVIDNMRQASGECIEPKYH